MKRYVKEGREESGTKTGFLAKLKSKEEEVKVKAKPVYWYTENLSSLTSSFRRENFSLLSPTLLSILSAP